MHPDTLTALKASIEHWKALKAAPLEHSIGSEACPLCVRFIHGGCIACPVAMETNQSGCEGSPYFEAADAYNDLRSNPDDPEAMAAWHREAQAELEFLEGLLP